MNNDKLSAYMGFCARARQLQTGYNTCLSLMDKGKVKLLLLAEDLSDNTKKKMSDKCKTKEIAYRIHGTIDFLSRITGKSDKGIFAITDSNFAKVIKEEIDRIQSEGEMI